MILEEEFDKLDEFDEGGVIYCHNAEQCAKIAEDFAIGFKKWCDINEMDKNYSHINTIEELLTLYKQTL